MRRNPRPPSSAHHRHGFTLVEMSIVLVVIGLLIGGVLAGQEMIQASKLSRVTSDAQKYITALIAFQTKYGALPGDFEKATDYWGANSVCPNGSGTGSATNTCNGNGDGHIGIVDGGNSICAENWQAWRQLSVAGFVPGAFSGTFSTGSANWCSARGKENVPAATLGEGAAFQFLSNNVVENRYYFGDFLENILLLGSGTNGFNAALLPTITPNNAHNIDTKMDDGMPGTGTVMGPISTNTLNSGCATTSVASTAKYVANDTDPLCMLFFRTGF